MFILSGGLFYGALKIAGKVSKKNSIIISSCTVLILVLCVISSPHNWMARLLPFSNVIIFAEANLLIVSFISGLAFKLIPGKNYRKLLLLVPLLIITFYSSYSFLLRPVPVTGDRCKGEVCIQSSESSCTAACAVTLLKHYGIQSTEKEMVELCMTRDNGTALLGAYRGLKIKTAGTKYSVKLEKWDLEKLLNTKFPVIIQAKLKNGADADPRYARQWGWTPGVSHSVIFYGRWTGDRVIIADPSVGRENWRVEGIKTLWHGRVLFLVKNN